MTTPKLVFLIGLLTFLPGIVSAQWHGPNVPDSLSFQGYLTDSTGAPIEGPTDMTFRLYKGVDEIWSQTQNGVQVSDGVFNVILGGSGSTSLDSVAFNVPIDLGITIGGVELAPRTPLTGSPYALAVRGMHAVSIDIPTGSGVTLIGGASNNVVSGEFVGATIGGGGGWSGATPLPNSIVGHWGTISGGADNSVGATYGTVGGGGDNTASGFLSTVGGGGGNTASAINATVAGGWQNTASAYSSIVAGGQENIVSGEYSTIAGGKADTAAANFVTVSGGTENYASGEYAGIGGGYRNRATGSNSTVSGGSQNRSMENGASIGGGTLNTADNTFATVGGGHQNVATGYAGAVPGGYGNAARGTASFAAGRDAKANHDGTFVWNDRTTASSSDSVASTGANQFLIRATGGVGINTNAPDRPISVQCLSGSCQWISFKDSSGVTKWHINHANNGFHISETGVSDDRFFIEPGGDVGLGTSDPVERLHVAGNYYGRGHVFLHAYEGDGSSGTAYIQARDKTASTTIGMTLRTQDAGTVKDAITIAANGDVHVLGNLSKGGGSFKIDHPLDPENKYLYHSFVESPDMMNVYNGNVILDGNGEATVELPPYFEALNRDFRYQLTAIGAPGPNLYVSDKISGNSFSIAGGAPGTEVSWQVTGVRKDPYAEQHRIQVEVEKPISERGTYLYPDGYVGTH